MESRVCSDIPLSSSCWTNVETDFSSPAATSGLGNQIDRSDGPCDCSVRRRHITFTPDQRSEWLTQAQNALDKIDIPFKDNLLQRLVETARHDLNLMSQNHPGKDEKLFPKSLQNLTVYLVGDATLPENISVLQTLADLGLGLEGGLTRFPIWEYPRLIKQLFSNTRHETVQRVHEEYASIMMFKADPAYMETLEKYLTGRQLLEAARELLSDLAKFFSVLQEHNRPLRFSDGSAPYLIKAIFESPDLKHGNPQASQDFYQKITTALHSEFFTLKLCLLEVNVQKYEELILKELKILDDKERDKILACTFILGQWELFKRLLQYSSPKLLDQEFNNGKNIFHVMATALPSMNSNGLPSNFCFLNTYLPRYDQLFQYLPAETLANQRDNSGASPLLLLYRHHCAQFASATISRADDCQLARARRSALIKLTTSGHLIECMQNHSEVNFPLNVNWFFEFLQLFKSLPPSTFQAVSLHSANYSYYTEIFHLPLPNATQLLQPVINYFEHHPDALRDEQQTLELIRLMHQNGLPVEYSAQVLRVVTGDMQKKLLEYLSATPDDRKALFIEHRYDVFYKPKHYYPWLLIGLGVGAGCAPDPDMFYSKRFLHEVAEFDRKHPKETVPEISEFWEAELINSGHIEIYGRSLAFPSTEVPQGFRRFKFLKQQHGATEDWHDFIREQPQLDFFRTHKELGLESALLKPRGIYHLTNALNKLKACGLPDETLATIALEPDGSALLHVFDDEKNTRLYHHYPYETQGVPGLSVQASFDGLRLFARDAGRLWQHNFQAPDTLSSFHNSANKRAWVPTPIFGGHSVPGTVGEWNAQDYPNIAPAPVGMRDWADVRSFTEQTSVSFGTARLYNTTHREGQGELRITELGRAFYGLVFHWLRVRHDTDNLDYTNTEQMNQLQEELVTIAADLFGCAYGMKPEAMKAKICREFPAESPTRGALECGYWCDPKVRYVQDIKSGRFPDEVYPNHPNHSFNREHLDPDVCNLTDKGIMRSSRAKGPNLGVNSGSLPLPHLDSLFWFAIYTGWRLHEPSKASPPIG